MTVKTIPLTAVSVQSAKATTRFGQLSTLPVSTTAQFMGRAAMTGIPLGAVVSSAIFTIRSRNNPTWSGSHAIKVRSLGGPFSTATTWSNKPASIASSEVTVTKSGAAFGTFWDFDITAMVQAWVSGTVANNGLIVFSADASVGQFQGAVAPWGPPILTVTYVTAAATPTALHPSSGAVSLAKPTLTFQVPTDTTSIQVQVDPAANATTPAYDSGEVASTAGLLDLSTTTYAGLADAASTQWRARSKNGLGWSAWSSWVTFSRAAWKTLTVTSPTATSEDPSPVVTATYGGTITSWRAYTKNSLGAVLQDSGWTPGSVIAFGTTKSVGATGTAVVQIRDSIVRDSTPGDPDYAQATQAFTVTPSGTPATITAVATSQDGVRPNVVVTGTRAGGVPDEVVIYRNNVLVGRVPGASVFTGVTLSYSDNTAPMNVPATYKVYAVVNGAWSNASATSTITPRCIGLWLFDSESTDAALILGNDDLDQSQPENAIVHRPISSPNGDPQVVRRRLGRYPREGVVSGTLIDVLGITAATSEANLRAWADLDAGHLYRLVLGNQSDLVILGDITFTESPLNGRERVLGVSANWWVQS